MRGSDKPNPNAAAPSPAAGESEADLSLEDTAAAQLRRGVPVKKTGVSGYNPYDAAPGSVPGGNKPGRKRTDLRKLSEWIRLQRNLQGQTKKEGDSE